MDENAIRQEFGRRVRRRRMALGLIQRELAQRIEMMPSQLSRLEKGNFHSIDLAKLILIAEALHTTVDYLLAQTNEAGEVPEKKSFRLVA